MWEIIKQIDLYEILYAAVGAFVGFFLAFIAEKRFDKFKRMQSITNVIEELISVNFTLYENIVSKISIELRDTLSKNEVVKNISDGDKSVLQNLNKMAHLIYIPIWQAVVNKGDLLDFRKEDYFEDLIQIYNRIIRVSNFIDALTSADCLDAKKTCNILKQCIHICDFFVDNNSCLGKKIQKEKKRMDKEKSR